MTILWLADNRSWAFASIVKHIGNALPEYNHRMIYMVEDSKNVRPEFFEEYLIECARNADVIVAMYIRYPEALPIETRPKTVLFLSGLRPFYGETDHSVDR